MNPRLLILASLPVLAWPALLSWYRVLSNSTTYEHCALVPFVCWALWRHAAKASPNAGASVARHIHFYLWGLLVATSGIGMALDIKILQHLSLVLIVWTAVAVLYGPDVLRKQRFAVGYLLFAVPFGDFLIPMLRTLTANASGGILHVLGFAPLVQGDNILIGSAVFHVADACAGLRFLVINVALGVLLAHVYMRTRRRQAAFVALSLLLPPLVNTVRVTLVVVVAVTSDMQYGTGLDHLLYGWVLTTAVMWALFATARRFGS